MVVMLVRCHQVVLPSICWQCKDSVTCRISHCISPSRDDLQQLELKTMVEIYVHVVYFLEIALALMYLLVMLWIKILDIMKPKFISVAVCSRMCIFFFIIIVQCYYILQIFQSTFCLIFMLNIVS